MPNKARICRSFFKFRPIPFVGNSNGMTMVELMVATAVMTIGVVGLIVTFGSLQKGTQGFKNKTLAANLAQEKMQILKQKNYYEVLVTPNPSFRMDYIPSIPYDTTYFPPETILEGGVQYTRLTYIQVADEDSGKIVELAPTTPDTGMRLITVSVLWGTKADQKVLTISSILANPKTVMTNSIFAGKVKDLITNGAIPGALVNIAENLGWRDTADGSGAYSIHLSPGSFTLVGSARGYFNSFQPMSVAPNQAVSQDLLLQPMSSGTVNGTVWMNPNLVISQVVVSTQQAEPGTWNNFQAQYIELFNPTTGTINIGGSIPNIKVNFQVANTCSASIWASCIDPTYGIKLNYVNVSVSSNSYYIIANTTTFTINGATIAADAYIADNADSYCTQNGGGNGLPAGIWNLGATPVLRQIMGVGHGGSVWLTDASGNIIDAVGWTHNLKTPINCETGCISLPGFAAGNQLVRITSPTWNVSDLNTYGNAYDSNNNSVDFSYRVPQDVNAHNTSSTHTVISGVPAIGAVISATDGLSDSTAAYSVGSPPVAIFNLTQVATGTWTVLISSKLYTLENDTVTIAASGSVYNFPSTTTILTQPNVHGFISGAVTDAYGNPITAPQLIAVSPGVAGSNSNASGATGRYLLRVSSGSIDVVANPNAGNPNYNGAYISQSSVAVSVSLGEVSSGVDFILSQGGRIKGFVTRDGINALPGVAVAAIDINGYARDTQVSGASGMFQTIDIATGVYTVTPELDTLETSSPTAITVTVSSGATVVVGTFTITGDLGTVKGNVTAGGAVIPTGVLIVVTTMTFAGSPPAPPALSTMTLTGTPYYSGSSMEDGTFSIDVRQSTSPAYNVYAYYAVFSSGTNNPPMINSGKVTNVQVLEGQTVTGVNFAW